MPKLDWLTRGEDEKTASRVPYRLLEAVPEHSYGDPNAENMLIQGDNLEALKALVPFYAGRVKMSMGAASTIKSRGRLMAGSLFRALLAPFPSFDRQCLGFPEAYKRARIV